VPATLESLDTKLDTVLERQERMERHLEEQNDRLRQTELCVARVQERQTLIQAGQVLYASIVAAIGSFLAANK
jgi:hypothetical protein